MQRTFDLSINDDMQNNAIIFFTRCIETNIYANEFFNYILRE